MYDRPISRHVPDELFRQARAFAMVGLVSTVAYACLFTLLRSFVMAGAANAAALFITAIGNTTANRVLTFGVRGRRSLARDHLAGFIALGVALLITSGAIALLGALAPAAERGLELSVLIGANAVATLVRFLLLRTWVHRDPRAGSPFQGARAEPVMTTISRPTVGPAASPTGLPGGPGAGGPTSPAVSAWVASVGTVIDYGGNAGTLYDLSRAATAGS
jgi:putative flippase GtrA